jgi:hypothetical protein
MDNFQNLIALAHIQSSKFSELFMFSFLCINEEGWLLLPPDDKTDFKYGFLKKLCANLSDNLV